MSVQMMAMPDYRPNINDVDLRLYFAPGEYYTLIVDRIDKNNKVHNYLYHINISKARDGEVLVADTSDFAPGLYTIDVFTQYGDRIKARRPSDIDEVTQLNQIYHHEFFIKDTHLATYDASRGTYNESRETYDESRASPVSKRSRSDTIVRGDNKKYCSCIIGVAKKQPRECLERGLWGQELDGKKCYNPYAVCARLKDRSVPLQPCLYNFEEMDDDELIAFASLRGIKIPGRKGSTYLTDASRDKLLDRIDDYLAKYD